MRKDGARAARPPIIYFPPKTVETPLAQGAEDLRTETRRSSAVLYRKMKSSQGGVMLRVRLHADLAQAPATVIRKLAEGSKARPPARFPSLFAPGSRLSITYDWLERQFGSHNAALAVTEVARELLA